MKTIQSRLQSRISKRRNAIRQVEEDVAVVKAQRRTARDIGFDGIADHLSETLNDVRELLNALAGDQRLDKRLKSIVSEYDSARRYYGLTELA